MARKPHMFSRLFDLGMQRTKLQAFGFYLAHLILYMLLSGLLMGVLKMLGVMGHTFDDQVQMAATLGPLMGLIHALTLIFLMLRAKRMNHTRKMVFIGAGAVVLGGIGGPLLSLIAISWMSTKAPEL